MKYFSKVLKHKQIIFVNLLLNFFSIYCLVPIFSTANTCHIVVVVIAIIEKLDVTVRGCIFHIPNRTFDRSRTLVFLDHPGSNRFRNLIIIIVVAAVVVIFLLISLLLAIYSC